LQNTLLQLSTGLKINSGSDDAAGLSIAAGLGSNIAALTQSSQNASNGVGFLQTADGALSQVTTLLNRAVTLATEASNGGLTPPRALPRTPSSSRLLSEITQIGSTTNFNGTAVFSATPLDHLHQRWHDGRHHNDLDHHWRALGHDPGIERSYPRPVYSPAGDSATTALTAITAAINTVSQLAAPSAHRSTN
jgi:flagellin-like hook-associated protein FlgL